MFCNLKKTAVVVALSSAYMNKEDESQKLQQLKRINNKYIKGRSKAKENKQKESYAIEI